MKIYVVRHGETDWNKQCKFQGRVDICLNENGKNAAIKLGEKIKSKNVFFDFIFSSPLKRAFKTAQLILQSLPQNQSKKINTDNRLIEITFGIYEGMTYSDWMNTDLPRKYFFDNPAKYVPPEKGESFESVCERTKDFVKNEIESKYQQNKDSNILIVSHGACLAGLMCYLENRTIENYWGNGLKKNCEETIYEFDGKSWKLI